MGTEEKDKGTFSELTEILDKTKDLTVLLKETESYRNYCQSLEKLKLMKKALMQEYFG